MKNLYLNLLAIILFISGSSSAEEKGKHLFILSGQSNMAGLDPNLSFTPAVEGEFGKENVVIVKDAQGGQPIRRWFKQWKPSEGDEPKATGDLYDRLMLKIKASTKNKQIESTLLASHLSLC